MTEVAKRGVGEEGREDEGEKEKKMFTIHIYTF